MSLNIIPRPSQGGETLKLQTFFFEDATQAGLKTKIEASVSIPGTRTEAPTGEPFIADIQYRVASGGAPPIINYSVMIIVGQWNPT